MKRTRRVEVIRYRRRVDAQEECSEGGIDELLAIARTHEFTCDRDEPLALPEPIPVPEIRPALRHRAVNLLRKLKP